jgi:hypothetical protein
MCSGSPGPIWLLSAPLYWERSRTWRPTVNDVINTYPISQPAAPQREGEEEHVLPPAWIPRRDKRISLSGINCINNPTGRQSWVFKSTHPTDPRLVSSDFFNQKLNVHIAFVLHLP